MSDLTSDDIRQMGRSELMEVAQAPGMWGYYDVIDVATARDELRRRAEAKMTGGEST